MKPKTYIKISIEFADDSEVYETFSGIEGAKMWLDAFESDIAQKEAEADERERMEGDDALKAEELEAESLIGIEK